MFENLKNALVADNAEQEKRNSFFIENGYLPTWAKNNQIFSDEGLKRYSTETRWNQYKNGDISREQAVAYAIKRNEKKSKKDLFKKLERLERVAAAPDLNFISVNVVYKRSYYWGWNPTAYSDTNNGRTTGTASGCGYDKESAAVASAFNQNDSVLKVLYTIKENALAAGVSDHSKTACTGVNNTECCGYGAGYTVLPYFEGGVGVSCFWSILEKAGFKTRCNYGKNENFYTVYKG